MALFLEVIWACALVKLRLRQRIGAMSSQAQVRLPTGAY